MNIYAISNSYRDFKSIWVNNLDIWDIKEKKYLILKATKFLVSGSHNQSQFKWPTTDSLDGLVWSGRSPYFMQRTLNNQTW